MNYVIIVSYDISKVVLFVFGYLHQQCPIKTYTINNFNCNNKNVVYLITWTECNLKYVGCTTNMLKIHIRRYLKDAKLTPYTNMSAVLKHFHLVHREDTYTSGFKFCGIERVMNPP